MTELFLLPECVDRLAYLRVQTIMRFQCLPAIGSYYHPFFNRDDPNQCHLIVRCKASKKGQDTNSIDASSGLQPNMALHTSVASFNDAVTSGDASTRSRANAGDEDTADEDLFAAFTESSGSMRWSGVEGDFPGFTDIGGAAGANNESIRSLSHPHPRLHVSTSLTDFQAVLDEQNLKSQNTNQAIDQHLKMPALSDPTDNALLRYLQNPPPDVLSSTLDRPLSAPASATSTSIQPNNALKQHQMLAMLKESCNSPTESSTVRWLLNGAASISDLSQVMEGYLPSNDGNNRTVARTNVTNDDNDDSLMQMSLECTTADKNNDSNEGCEQFQDEIVSLFGGAGNKP